MTPPTPQSRISGLSNTTANKKAARERVRATRACDRCKVKKARCTGTTPCALCVRLGLECLYNASYRRGKTPYIPPAATIAEQTQPVSLSPQTPALPRSEYPQHATSAPEQQSTRETSSEPQLSDPHDLQGSYLGPASGVSFLTRAKKRLREDATTPSTSIFAFGDTPLPQHDASFLILPPKDQALRLIGVYFDFAFPTHRYLHRPTVEAWCDELYVNQTRYSCLPGTRERNAVVLMVLAQAQLTSSYGSKDKAEASVVFYAASENQLARETGETRLTSVMARLLQCFYLASQSRINHCWNLFGTTARLALAVGLHRKQRQDQRINFVEAECRKRTFWAAYSLDRYLSAALGRPKAFHDDDIDQDLPECADDDNILPHKIEHPLHRTQSVMQAANCHTKLTKIVSGILKEQYSIHRMTTSSHASIAAKYSSILQIWHQESSAFVSKRWNDILLLAAPFSRQCEVLILAHGHAVILLHRPLLLCDMTSPEDRIAVQLSARQCIDAATRILLTFRDSCESRRMVGAFWLIQYYVFCAIAVLYVCIIRKLEAPEQWTKHMSMADECQALLSKNALQASFARRYGIFLEELKAEAQRKIDMRSSVSNEIINTSAMGAKLDGQIQQSEFDQDSEAQLDMPSQDLFPLDYTPLDHASSSSLFEDLTNWEELDSFVMAGMGFDFDASFAPSEGDTAGFGFGDRMVEL